MAIPPIFMSIKGIKALQRRMSKMGRGLKDRRKVNARAVVVTDRWIQKNFQQEGALAYPGTGWKPLSPVTIAARRKGKGKGSVKILQDTGQLRSRWKKLWTSKFAKIQSGVPYSDKHHKGVGHIPERRILPTEAQIRPELMKLFADFIKKVIK